MSIKKGVTACAVGVLVCIALMGLRTSAVAQHEAAKAKAQGVPITKAVALLMHTQEGEAEGRVTFTQTEKGIHVTGEISGLKPNSKHGFHVHEFGVWSPDGKAAGGHFNPTGQQHGEREATKRHIGDLGNIEAKENGKAEIDFVDSNLKFDGPTSIIGRGLVVHEKADDYGQPVGNAGGRVAVGVIGVARP